MYLAKPANTHYVLGQAQPLQLNCSIVNFTSSVDGLLWNRQNNTFSKNYVTIAAKNRVEDGYVGKYALVNENLTLVVNNVDYSDAGQYECRPIISRPGITRPTFAEAIILGKV